MAMQVDSIKVSRRGFIAGSALGLAGIYLSQTNQAFADESEGTLRFRATLTDTDGNILASAG